MLDWYEVLTSASYNLTVAEFQKEQELDLAVIKMVDSVRPLMGSQNASDLAAIEEMKLKALPLMAEISRIKDLSRERGLILFDQWIEKQQFGPDEWYLIDIKPESKELFERDPDRYLLQAQNLQNLEANYLDSVMLFREHYRMIGDDDIRLIEPDLLPQRDDLVLVRAREAFVCRLQGRSYIKLE